MLDVRPRRCHFKRSLYCGSCDAYARRDGLGSESWKGESYRGRFVTDSYHGEGAYKWVSGTVFEGRFYSDCKEGYGVVSLPDGSVFEGLFCNDRAFGPGVRTDVTGRQDVGFWCGRRLVRLGRAVDFIIPRLASTSAGKLKLLRFHMLVPFVEENADIGSALALKHGFDPERSHRLYSNFVRDPRSLFFNRKRLDKVFFVKVKDTSAEWQSSDLSAESGRGEQGKGNAVVRESDSPADEDTPPASTQLISWNRSELSMEILKQIFRFRSFEDDLSYKISDVMAGARTKFRKTGDAERISLNFLKMCSIGPAYIIKDLLCRKNVSEALVDSRGNNSIMFAAAADQHDVIDLLLNYGADVNSFNDENLTPLNLCLLRRIDQTFCLGNWEVSFLPPEESSSGCESKMKMWRVYKSIQSLDRIFGDGMSAEGSEAARIDFGQKLGDTDSVFCFAGDDQSETEASGITILDYRAAAVADDPPEVSTTGNMSALAGNNELTLEVGRGFMPGSYKREEFARSVASPTERDRYFFDLSPEKACEADAREKMVGRASAVADDGLNKGSHMTFSNKIAAIDKTIEQLLTRGADPNLADAPKPSLHLAVYSRDSKLVRLLLTYGASPDSQSLPQEGSLTPLHVLVLMKPSREQVTMCQLLLNHGASPEEETTPGYSPGGEDDAFLRDAERGRTPLQLLCTRPDAELVDPEGFLSQIAQLLVAVSKRNHFFKGHSYLSLAMLSGNLAIMKAILDCPRTNPNEVLGNNLGTPLHVLLSTSLQKRTSYQNSIKMCDMLLERGADPNLVFKKPTALAGTCVDYGYRQIREQTQAQESDPSKRPRGKAENPERDIVRDHVKVVEYVEGRLEGGGKRRNGPEPDRESAGSGKEAPQRFPCPSAGASRSLEECLDPGGGTTGWKAGTAEEDGQGQRKDRTGEKDEAKIIEIKKHQAGKDKGGVGKALPKTGGKAGRAGKDGGKAGKAGKGGGKAGKAGKDGGKAGKAGRGGGKDGKKRTGSKVGGSERDKGRSRGIRGTDRMSDRLPERFRQSLLHMFGSCATTFDLDELLLPYVVLRNGDLYYRFKGRKRPGTEQYSLI